MPKSENGISVQIINNCEAGIHCDVMSIKSHFEKQTEETMPPAIQGIITVAARVLLALIFLMSAVGNKIPKFSDVAGLMESQGVPAPQIMLAGAIAFLLLGSLSIIVGFKARIGATMLLIFLVLATYFFHDFWTWPQDAMWILSSNSDVKMPVAQIEMISFMKNLALMGAMLFLIANGAGPMSFDAKLNARKSK